MTYRFQLAEFSGSDFFMETSMWTGKSKLYKDGLEVERLREGGKPYLIPAKDGSYVPAFPKYIFAEFSPGLEINGHKIPVAEKLKWYQLVIGGLPILLVLLGGLIGGAIGGGASVINFSIFRQEGSPAFTYLKVILINIGAYVLFFVLAFLFSSLFA